MIAVLDALASRSGELVAAVDLRRAGCHPTDVAGTFAGLIRLFEVHYQYQIHGWPMTRIVRRGRHAVELLYSTSAEQAQKWIQVRRHADHRHVDQANPGP